MFHTGLVIHYHVWVNRGQLRKLSLQKSIGIDKFGATAERRSISVLADDIDSSRLKATDGKHIELCVTLK